MNCECVYIFKNEDDRTIEMYQKLAELIARFEGEFDPYCLAISKREVSFMDNYDSAMLSDSERRAEFEKGRKAIKSELKVLDMFYKNAGFDISKFKAAYNSDISAKEISELWKEFSAWLVKSIVREYDYMDFWWLCRYLKAYCSTYKDCYFNTKKGNIFMWVSGKYLHMNDETMMEMAKTPEDKELISKVMIGFPARCEGIDWFEDMEEPKLPTWEDVYGADEAV